jgi:hypothetical protein
MNEDDRTDADAGDDTGVVAGSGEGAGGKARGTERGSELSSECSTERSSELGDGRGNGDGDGDVTGNSADVTENSAVATQAAAPAAKAEAGSAERATERAAERHVRTTNAVEGEVPGEQTPQGETSGAEIPEAAAAAPAPRKTSRRFPVLTRDTARPEGGGRAIGGHHPAPYRQWPLLTVCAGVLVGLFVTVAQFRVGTLIVGLSLVGGAVVRWWKPSVGMLAVRSRFTDMITYGVLGLSIVLFALMAQPDPKISLPFLDTIVHFAVR